MPAGVTTDVQLPAMTFDGTRLAALDAYDILDTGPERAFDDVVNLATLVCEAPVALVSLVARDRQWFKARIGFASCQTDLNSSVCAHALIEPDLLVIPDLTADPRTSENPLVTGPPGIRFYAGAPLRTAEGAVLGSLCVIDLKARPEGLAPRQAEALRNLARQVISHLELRRSIREREALLEERASTEARRNGLLALGDLLRDLETIPEMTQAAAAMVGRTLGLKRAGFGRIDRDVTSIRVEGDWTADGIASLAGRRELRPFGPEIRADLLRAVPVAIEDVTTDPRTAADPGPLLAIGARSLANMPVLMGGRPVALLFAHDDAPRIWPAEVLAFLRNVADRVEAGAARLRAEEEQRVLNQELVHRMKNTFAMVQAIAAQTLRSVPDQEPVQAFNQRLHALSAAHDVLLQRSWAAAEIGSVIHNVLGIVERLDRFTLDGPEIVIGPRATLSLSLLLHELSTNAIKYGALSDPSGTIAVAWRLERSGPAEELVLEWRESGGPPVGEPNRRGFGSRLIRTGLVGTGGVALRFLPRGLEADFRAPLDEVQLS